MLRQCLIHQQQHVFRQPFGVHHAYRQTNIICTQRAPLGHPLEPNCLLSNVCSNVSDHRIQDFSTTLLQSQLLVRLLQNALHVHIVVCKLAQTMMRASCNGRFGNSGLAGRFGRGCRLFRNAFLVHEIPFDLLLASLVKDVQLNFFIPYFFQSP